MNTTLAPLTPDNLISILDIRNTPDFILNCTNRIEQVNLSEFKEEITRDFAKDRYNQFIVYKKDQIVGTVWSYGYIKNDGYIFVSLYIKPKYRKSIFTVKVLMYFVSLLFRDNPNLFKIYFDVYEYNLDSSRPLEKFGLKIEGRFLKQKLLNKNRFDVLRYAFYRDQLMDLSKYLA